MTEPDAQDFAALARLYAVANSASKEIAREKLKALGIIDASGKLTKNYR